VSNDILSYLNDLIVAVQQIKFLLEALAKFSKRQKKMSQLCKVALEAHFICKSCMLLAKIIIVFDLLKINEDV